MEFEKDRENDLRVVWQAGTPSTAALFESLVFRQFSQTDSVSTHRAGTVEKNELGECITKQFFPYFCSRSLTKTRDVC